MARLDERTGYPSGMEEYLSFYGWHFSKKMCQWAVSMMYKEGHTPIEPITMDMLSEMERMYGVEIGDAQGYDAVYIANMCKADFLGDSVVDEEHLVRYVRNVINDPDAYEGMPFTRFYADCIGSGTPIIWEDML